jgi:hypothetical protein
MGALELAEDLVVALAGDVGEHVEATAVRHARCTTSSSRRRPPHRAPRRAAAMADSPPSRLNRFWPDVLGLQERLEGLGRVEATEDAHLLVSA